MALKKNTFTSFKSRMHELRAESLNAAQILPLTPDTCEVRPTAAQTAE